MPLDAKQLPRDVATLQKIVLDLAEQLDRSLTEQNKYQNLLRELLEAQHNRKSEQLSKEQLALFEAAWKAENETAKDADDSDDDLDSASGQPTNLPGEKKALGLPIQIQKMMRTIRHKMPAGRAGMTVPVSLYGDPVQYYSTDDSGTKHHKSLGKQL